MIKNEIIRRIHEFTRLNYDIKIKKLILGWQDWDDLMQESESILNYVNPTSNEKTFAGIPVTVSKRKRWIWLIKDKPAKFIPYFVP